MTPDGLLEMPDVCERLKCSTWSVHKMMRDGRIDHELCEKVAGKWLIHPDALPREDPPPGFLSVEQVAERLGVSRETVRVQIARGRINRNFCVKEGNVWHILPRALPGPTLKERNRGLGVYFIEGTGLIKIGHSKDVGIRFSELQIASPVELTLLHVEWCQPGTVRDLERMVHAHFEEYRSRGEWFALPYDWKDDLDELLVGWRDQHGELPPLERVAA